MTPTTLDPTTAAPLTVYKLTTPERTTRNGFTYEIGVPAHATGPGTALCSSGVLHAYHSPAMAALMAPAHCERTQRTLWRATTPALVADDGTKVGVKTLTLVESAVLPTLTPEQRVQIAITVAWAQGQHYVSWRTWALAWLRRENRTRAAAYAAAYAADNFPALLLLVLSETCTDTATRLEAL